MSGADFETVLYLAAFMTALYAAGRFCQHVHLSPIVGEIVVGILLGPHGVDVVPFADFFQLAGVVGVTLMIFESGLHGAVAPKSPCRSPWSRART